MSAVAASFTESTACKVFVKNLDWSVDNKCLFDTLSIYGTIKSCKVSVDEEGGSRGYGFVHFETEEAAQKAILEANGMNLAGKKLFVAKCQTRAEHIRAASDSFTNIFVKNFERDVDDAKLKTIFGKFGEITSCAVMRDFNNNSKGFGFVAFKNPEDAQSAVKELHKMTIEGTERKLYVTRAQKKSDREVEQKKIFERQWAEVRNGFNLYVKNFDDSVDDEALRKIFAPFGAITSAKVMKYDNGRSKGFGFVCFEKAEDANKACNVMNYKLVGSRLLYVAMAQRKVDRQLELTSQIMSSQGSMRMRNEVQGGPMNAPGQNGYYVADPNQSGIIPGVGVGAPVMVMAHRGDQGVQEHQLVQPFMTQNGGCMPQYAAEAPFVPRTPPQLFPQEPVHHSPVVPTAFGYPHVPHQAQVAMYPIPTYGMPGASVMNQQWFPQPCHSLQGIIGAEEQSLATYTTVQAESEDQKQVLGEQVYALINRLPLDKEKFEKITEIVQKMDTTDLSRMLQDTKFFYLKVDEGVSLLHHSANFLPSLSF